MIISIDCFLDEELRSIIRAKKKKGFCDVLNRECDYVYDTSRDNDLVDLIVDFLSIFKLADNSIEPKNKFKLEDELFANWNIFCNDCKGKGANVLKAIITDSSFSEIYEVDLRVFEEDVYIPELLDQDFLKNYSLLYDHTWDYFSEQIKYNNRFHCGLINLDILWFLLSSLQRTYDKGHCFYRARLIKTNQPLNDKDLFMPPKDKRKPGRIGAAGSPCFYLANDIETSICEVRAGAHDFVAVGEFCCKKDLSIIDLREIDRISPFAISNMILYRVNKKTLEQIKNEIEKPIRSNDNDIDYVPIQYICDYIRSKQIDGIVYRSTMRSNGFNLSAFDDNLFDLNHFANYSIKKIDYDYYVSQEKEAL